MRARFAGRDRGEDLADGNHERPRQADEHVRSRIGFRELDPADVLVIQAGELSQPLLRQLSLEPQPTQLRTERAQDGRPLARFSHRYFSASHMRLCTALLRPLEPSIVVMISV